MRRTPLLLLLTACADPRRVVYATSAEGELTLFQIALIEGYQIGTGEIRINASIASKQTIKITHNPKYPYPQPTN